MSGLDLSAAVEVAAKSGYEAVDITGVPWSFRISERSPFRYGKEIRRAEAILTAAAPLIEAQVREQVARKIGKVCVEVANDPLLPDRDLRPIIDGLVRAARIARDAS